MAREEGGGSLNMIIHFISSVYLCNEKVLNPFRIGTMYVLGLCNLINMGENKTETLIGC